MTFSTNPTALHRTSTFLRLGVDTGGTFTDFVLLEGAALRVHKVSSTPDDPSRAILQGVVDLLGKSSENCITVDLVHGSTVATNALLERKGAAVALITTAGFEDVLLIGRQTRPELYNFFVKPRQPLIQTGCVIGLKERLTADGSILEPLDESTFSDVATTLRSWGVESVAVCLLHAYRNPVHERKVLEYLETEGFLVSASHRILPEYREFERCSTTVVNAYVRPVMSRYLTSLETKLGALETADAPALRIMQSNGGTISAATARTAAVQTILSGPAGGAVGAREVARLAGFGQVIGFDMGGTSTDVTLIDGELSRTMESVVGDFPVRLPIIDIHTVGAGGGSIAYVDTGGALRVGPQSAGANPGPICYGRGTELTVTDANLLLGRLDPERFFGGRMKLDLERVRHYADAFAKKLGISIPELAEGIIRIANANMERAIRVVSVQRGYDPRQFALMAFGGAGGMHACQVAESLEMPTVIVPRLAGVLSALGMLFADVVKDFSQTLLVPAQAIPFSDLERRFHPLIDQARHVLTDEGFTSEKQAFELVLDLRYTGQSYELTISLSKAFEADFHAAHARTYGYANPEREVEIVNLRLKAVGLTSKPVLPQVTEIQEFIAEPSGFGTAYFGGKRVKTAIFDQPALLAGATGRGPALITGPETTIVIPPKFSFRVDGFGNVILEAVKKSG
ncbi:MAG: hydantoinase/oxoprolinase family protein [Acidobacteria bacterium]|nr:hydantoinase/oxoprolinase family protein [Acidobacteriota bacterium]